MIFYVDSCLHKVFPIQLTILCLNKVVKVCFPCCDPCDSRATMRSFHATAYMTFNFDLLYFYSLPRICPRHRNKTKHLSLMI